VHSTVIPAIVAGFIEGVVEWLPVSSKTIITLYFAAIGVKVASAYSLGLIANFGSFFAALFYFRKEVWEAVKSLRSPFSDEPYARLLRFIVVGTVATGMVGIPIYLLVQRTFSVVSGSVAMLIIGVLLIVTSFITRRKEKLVQKENQEAENAKPVTLKPTLITGAAQGLAALPGISRSAITMTPLLWMGFSAEESLRLSFMLDVVALVGAAVVPLTVGHEGRAAVMQLGLAATLVMLVVAAVVSFVAIRLVLGFARRLRTSIVTLVIGGVTILVPFWAIVQLIVHK
jgi:undecaprenyl-diphosphatase